MNLQLGDKGINWTDATWNPITGCNHGCPYCYARRLYERFGRSFSPAFHPDELPAPTRRKKATKIFVGSTADVFGNWVPNDWVRSILSVVRECPQHTFQFLTKAPHNLVKFNHWPRNCWVGATANNQAMMDNAIFCLALTDAPVKFISAEPLLGPIAADLSGIDWLIIGAQTGTHPLQPEHDWVNSLIECARQSGTAVFFKENLRWPVRINEWPARAPITAQPALL